MVTDPNKLLLALQLTITEVLIVGGFGFLYLLVTGCISGWIVHRFHAPVAYSRKTFHLFVISGAAVVQIYTGLGGTCLYGSLATLLVLYGVCRGSGNLIYDALARESDHPRERHFIVLPLGMTILGGIISNILFFPWAPVGYIACAWGDAVGEPVGSRWGRHRYRVPSLLGVPAQRSLEGSAAVFLAATIATASAFYLLNMGPNGSLALGLLSGLTTAATEAVSHHGTDNFTIQVVVSAVAYYVHPILS